MEELEELEDSEVQDLEEWEEEQEWDLEVTLPLPKLLNMGHRDLEE